MESAVFKDKASWCDEMSKEPSSTCGPLLVEISFYAAAIRFHT